MGHRLGVDVGGTFTDVQMQDTDTGDVTLVKVLSTPADQSVGVLEGVRKACRRTGASPQDLEQILHLARAWTPGPPPTSAGRGRSPGSAILSCRYRSPPTSCRSTVSTSAP